MKAKSEQSCFNSLEINLAAPNKTCLRAYADSEGSDQSAHPRSLVRVFTVHLPASLDTVGCISGE